MIHNHIPKQDLLFAMQLSYAIGIILIFIKTKLSLSFLILKCDYYVTLLAGIKLIEM
jgi:hypothetical protein